MDLEAARPGTIEWAGTNVDENSTVAGLIQPAPLRVQSVIFVARRGYKITYGSPRDGEAAVRLPVADGGNCGSGTGDKFPASKIRTAEKLVCRRGPPSQQG